MVLKNNPYIYVGIIFYEENYMNDNFYHEESLPDIESLEVRYTKDSVL